MQVVLDGLQLLLGFCLAKSRLDMLADLPRNRTSNQSTKKKGYGIKADAGLSDRSWCTGKRRSPADVQSGANVRNGCDNAGKSADPGAQSQRGQYNKDKENEKKEMVG